MSLYGSPHRHLLVYPFTPLPGRPPRGCECRLRLPDLRFRGGDGIGGARGGRLGFGGPEAGFRLAYSGLLRLALGGQVRGIRPAYALARRRQRGRGALVFLLCGLRFPGGDVALRQNSR